MIKMSVVVTTMLKDKPAKVKISLLIVAPDVSLTRPLTTNADVVTTLIEIAKPPFLVTNAFGFNPAIVVLARLISKPLVIVTTMLEVKPVKIGKCNTNGST